MKKKLIGIGVCILFLAMTVSAGTSVKNSGTNTPTPSHSLTSMIKMTTKVPTTGFLKNNILPTMIPSKSTQSEGLAGWNQQAKLLASDGEAEDFFTSLGISLSGDTALIGAWGDDDKGADAGSAYAFTRTGTTWTQQAKFLALDEEAGDAFGWCVAIEGDTAFIGAAGDDNLKGSVYLFTRSGTTWTEQAKLVAADGAAGDQFGYSIYLSGDTALIGANCDDDNGFDSGSAYVFIRIGTTWTQQIKLLPSDGEAQDSFGGEVSISDETALIGSCFDDDKGFDSGSAYIFIRTGTTWTEEAKLLASDGAPGDYFSAYAVSISGDTALIGAAGDDMAKGSAYVFTRTGTTWTEQAKLLTSDGITGDSFGGSVSLSGDTAIIGAGGEDDNGPDSGSVYEFIRTDTTWAQETKLLASDGSGGDVFGWDVALDGNTALIGAYYDDDNGADSGSAYVFTKESENQPPVTPTAPAGPTIGNLGLKYDFTASTTDPEGDNISYLFDWGDGSNSGWLVPEVSGATQTASHAWGLTGTYNITVKAKDVNGAESGVSNALPISIIAVDIQAITGGFFKVKASIFSGAEATNIDWKIQLSGGLIIFGKETTGTIPSISPNGSAVISSKLILGFGKIVITVTAGPVTKSQNATVLLIFIKTA